MIQKKRTLSAALSLVIAGGSVMCYGQARDADAAVKATAAHADMAMGGQQVDQQVQQQLQKIAQQKDNMTGDRLFVLNTALGSMYEVALAQQAEQKSQDQHVKQVAQQIVQDHQQANQQLMPVAQKLGLDLPQGLTSMKQQELQIITSMESKMFDQKFICEMDAHHAHDVSAFRSETQIGQSQEAKQFAQQTLPKLQQHWQMVKQAGTALGLSSDTDAQPAGSHIQGTSPRSTDTSGSASPENRPSPTRPPTGQNAPNSTGTGTPK